MTNCLSGVGVCLVKFISLVWCAREYCALSVDCLLFILDIKFMKAWAVNSNNKNVASFTTLWLKIKLRLNMIQVGCEDVNRPRYSGLTVPTRQPDLPSWDLLWQHIQGVLIMNWLTSCWTHVEPSALLLFVSEWLNSAALKTEQSFHLQR